MDKVGPAGSCTIHFDTRDEAEYFLASLVTTCRDWRSPGRVLRSPFPSTYRWASFLIKPKSNILPWHLFGGRSLTLLCFMGYLKSVNFSALVSYIGLFLIRASWLPVSNLHACTLNGNVPFHSVTPLVYNISADHCGWEHHVFSVDIFSASSISESAHLLTGFTVLGSWRLETRLTFVYWRTCQRREQADRSSVPPL